MRHLYRELRYIGIGAIMLSMTAMSVGCSNKDKNKSSEETTTASPQAAAESGSETVVASKESVQTPDLTFDSSVLKVGDEDVTYREALIYILQIKNKYEPSLGEAVWKYTPQGGASFSETAKNEILGQITETKIVKQQAKELGIKLESDEIDEVTANVNEYLSKITKEDQQKYGITQEIVQRVLEDNYLFQKVYNIATNEVDTNVSDDAAKQIKVQMLEVITNGQDKAGNKIEMTEDQKKAAKSLADKLRKQVDKEKDFATFATANTDAPKVEITFGKGDYPEFEQQAFALKQGQVSDVIETSSGYVILKLVSAFDEVATKAKKEAIIEQERDKVFKEKYKTWSGEYKVTQDITKWKAMSFDI